MDWFSLFLGWIPLWVWITLVIVIAAPILFYFGPVLLPIWRMLPVPVRVFLGGALAVLIAWAGGRYKGAKAERDEQARREAGATRNRAEVDQDVSNLPKKELHDRLSHWNRPDE